MLSCLVAELATLAHRDALSAARPAQLEQFASCECWQEHPDICLTCGVDVYFVVCAGLVIPDASTDVDLGG